jgi:hypothetical protein
MESANQRKFRWFWPWQDEREEEWLGALSREGWHLQSFGFPSAYYFRMGDPKDYVYRLDFQNSSPKDRQAYLQLFHDAGWEHIGKMSAWEYFRKEAHPGEEPEIFNDPESKIHKYERVIGFMIIFFPILIVLSNSSSSSNAALDIFVSIIHCFFAVILLIYAFGILKIYLRINQLKKTVRK